MATRKIRLTLSGNQVLDSGPIIDVDFNGVNLDVDFEITALYGSSTIVKEYTVDVPAGTYPLDITFKNDLGNDLGEGDRNLYINQIEISNNGIEYVHFPPSDLTSNLVDNLNYSSIKAGYSQIPNPNYDPNQSISDSNLFYTINPDYNSELPRTDLGETGYIFGAHPGDNPKYLYKWELDPITIWNSGITTFYITFS